MPDVSVYAVTSTGAKELELPYTPGSLYDLPDTLSLGVYTVLRTFEHYKFLQLSAHLRRLAQSMSLLRWRYALDEGAVRRALHQVCVAYEHPDMRVRIDVLARPATSLGSKSRVLLTLAPFEPQPATVYERGVRLGLAPHLHRREPRAKTADFAVARRQYTATNTGVYEHLLLDEKERLLEGSGSNFYAVRGGCVFTAEDGVLEGITRKIILQLIDASQIELQLEAVRLADVRHLDEAFLSSSSRGLIPVREIEGRVIRQSPGPITRRLATAYEQYVAQNVRPAVALDEP